MSRRTGRAPPPRLPAELWRLVGAHLAEADRVTLFWTLWRAGALAPSPPDLVACYRDFVAEP